MASALFIPAARPGLLIWVALLTHPRLAFGALLGLAIGHEIKRGLLPSLEQSLGGGVVTNAALAGIACMWLTRHAGLDVLVLLMVTASTAFAASVLSVAFEKLFEGRDLPPLGLGYIVVAGCLFVAFPHWAHQAVLATDWGPAPDRPVSFLTSLARVLGSLFFMPDPLAGILIGVAVLLWSPMAFVFGTTGLFTGVIMSAVFINLGEIFFWLPISYAFFLSGLALSGSFFVASRAGFAVAAAAGFFAALFALAMQYALAWSPAAYLPVPLILTIWLGILALRADKFIRFVVWNENRHLPPERTWLSATLEEARWPSREPLLTVPLGGPSQITQGFDDTLSHRGEWRYAVDFQRPLPAGQPETERGSLWDEPVYSPVEGVIAAVSNDVPDNPLGVLNYHQPWGNHVVIRIAPGLFATVAHLKQRSLVVAPGMRVSYGTLLGRVGNSGRSPVPHLHVQVQTAISPASPTRPFLLANCVSGEEVGQGTAMWHSTIHPAKSAIVTHAHANPITYRVLTSMIPGKSLWSETRSGSIPGNWRAVRERSGVIIERTVLADGSFRFFEPHDGAELILTLAGDALRCVAYRGRLSPLLTTMGLAISTVPYAAYPGLEWSDTTPVPSLWWRRHVPHLACLFEPLPLTRVRAQCRTADEERGLVLVATILERLASLPERVTITISPIRGPIELAAEFPAGVVRFDLVTFETAKHSASK